MDAGTAAGEDAVGLLQLQGVASFNLLLDCSIMDDTAVLRA